MFEYLLSYSIAWFIIFMKNIDKSFLQFYQHCFYYSFNMIFVNKDTNIQNSHLFIKEFFPPFYLEIFSIKSLVYFLIFIFHKLPLYYFYS